MVAHGTPRPTLLIRLLAILFLWPATARAEQARAPEIVGLRVGFAGCYKAGLWTPVEVTLRGGSRPVAAACA